MCIYVKINANFVIIPNEKGFYMKIVLLYIVISFFSITHILFASDNINLKETKEIKEQSNKVVHDEYKWGASIVDDQSFNIKNLPENKDYEPCAKEEEIKQCGD